VPQWKSPSHVERIAAAANALTLVGYSDPRLFPQVHAFQSELLTFYSRRRAIQKFGSDRPLLYGEEDAIRQFEEWSAEQVSILSPLVGGKTSFTVQEQAQRENSSPISLGLSSALTRLRDFVKPVSFDSRTALWLPTHGYQMIDSRGWRRIFYRVLEQDCMVAVQWRKLLAETKPGSDRWLCLIHKYAVPVAPVALGVFMHRLERAGKANSAIAMCSLGHSTGNIADWYHLDASEYAVRYSSRDADPYASALIEESLRYQLQ
jgi:hypothetical protein